MSRILTTSLVFICLLFLQACGQPSSDKSNQSSQAAEDENAVPQIGLVMKSLANEFFVNMAEEAKAHQAKHSQMYSLIVNGTKNESDLAQQVALIDQMIASGVDAIVIAPADSKAVVPAIVRALKAGITVVNIDNRLDEQALSDYGVSVPFVGPDNKAGARMAAEFAASRLNEGDPVIVLEGIPSAINSQQRVAGFMEAINSANLNLVARQSADWEQTKAAQVSASLLIQHPETTAIFAANDNMALGALAAVQRANLSDSILIVGFDNINAIQSHIESGDVLVTVDQFGGQLAVFGIEKALAALEGQSLDAITQTPLELITASAAD
uniref:sugar ABC transporter substrate-binding protein n=1 Tax=Ningiella ruwaisensis TaxID=2364274 RepID=UPI0019D62608|nr:sugar ABC transporter substrate-binding protein [Ningiella ruwaisensis]